jgi:tRNA threonylcarbamoyladenosine biosynthesis protein TsaB
MSATARAAVSSGNGSVVLASTRAAWHGRLPGPVTAPPLPVTWPDVLVLALDTATPTLVAGVARWSAADGGQVLAERAVPSGTRHAELLTPAIRGALVDAGVALPDIQAVVVGLGPGPFTGLRVGVVTAATLADARGIPAVGVCSLDAIGHPEQARVVVTDARRKEVYWAAYADGGARTDGPAVVRPEELGLRGPFVGNARFAERLAAPVATAEVTTAGLLRAAAQALADPSSAGPLVPLYLRRPDAVPPTWIKPVSRPEAGR